MLKKYLERQLLVESYDEVRLKDPIELEYYLIESEAENITLNDSGRTYGLGIVRRIGDKCFEEKIVRNYSSSPDETRTVLELLAGNSVTPCCMLQVLDDLLATL